MRQYVGIELEGRYRLDRVVDSGSFGAVYDAVDQKFDSRVAVKILFESAVDSRAFRSEALLARRFRHPNVVEVFDFGVDPEHGVAFIVMEFLEGARADQLMIEPDLPRHLFYRFVDQVGSALETAHQRQLVHRDLKPQNIMLIDRGLSTERFVLLDLGVATKTDSAATLRNAALDGAMSPQYASPEQVQRASVDFRSDVYSFGAILYEWLTGRQTFESDNLLGLVTAICKEIPVSPAEFVNGIPEDVESTVMQCLEKEPESRPESIGEIRTRILNSANLAGGSFGADQLIGNDLGWGTDPPPNSLAFQTLMPGQKRQASATQNLSKEKTTPEEEKTWQRDETVKRSVPVWSIVLLVIAALGAGGWFAFRGWTGEREKLPIKTADPAIVERKVKENTAPVDAPVVENDSVKSLEVWHPDGFTAANENLIESKFHGVSLHQQISCVRGDQVVEFVLVTSSKGSAPFYIMKNKVWNGLLSQYAAANAKDLPDDPDRTTWRQGAMANGHSLGVEDHPELPVMNLTAFEAHRVASWVGGPLGHLPSASQWDVAAGLEQWKSGTLGPEWRHGPFRQSSGRSEVAIGLRPFGPRAVGSSADDIGPFGCLDMAGNGFELTSSSMGEDTVPACQPDAWVLTRGRNYQSKTPLQWNHLEAASTAEFPDGIEARDRNPNIGFRVVVEIQPTSSE